MPLILQRFEDIETLVIHRLFERGGWWKRVVVGVVDGAECDVVLFENELGYLFKYSGNECCLDE